MRVAAAPFVGRERELERLREAVARGGTVLVTGEAGLGKTRLLEELAADTGRHVLWGTCHPDDWRLPLEAWAQVAEELVRAEGPLALERLGPLAQALHEAVPALGAEVENVPVASLPPGEARYRTFEAFARLLSDAGRPLLVVLDDLQWADSPTVDLLLYVGRGSWADVAVAAGYREGEPALELALADLHRHPHVERVALTRMGSADAAVLADAVSDRPLDAALRDRLVDRAEGNPFFLTQLVRHAAEHPDEEQVPPTVRHAVVARTALLSPEAARTLTLASVFTGPFELAVVSHLAGQDEETSLSALDELLARRLVRAAGADFFVFSHALIRHSLYEEMNPSRRARLHRRVAAAIESVHGDRAEEHAAELAWQFQASAAIAGAEHGAPFAVTAARRSAAVNAWDQAVAFFRVALDLGSTLPDADRARILAELAHAEAHALQVDAAVETAGAAAEQLAAADGPSAAAAFLADVAWTVAEAGGRLADVARLSRRGLELVDASDRLTWARLMTTGRPYEPYRAGPLHCGVWRGHDPEAVRILRGEGGELDYARTLDVADPWSKAELDELLELSRTWTDLGARIRATRVVAQSLVHIRSDPLGRAGPITEFEELAAAAGAVPWRADALLWVSEHAYARGDFDAAVAAGDAARELIAQLGPGHRLHRTMGGTSAGEYLVLGNWSTVAERHFSFACDPLNPPGMGLSQATRAAYAFARAGESERARQVLEWVTAPLLELPLLTLNRNLALVWACETMWELGGAAALDPFRTAIAELLEVEWAVHGIVTSVEVAAAGLESLAGDLDAARALYERARVLAERRGERPLRALADFHEGATLQRAGRGGDEPLRAALAAFDELGMTTWSERTRDLLAARGDLPDGLTRREAEILARVAAGESNKEIAAALVLSVRTVERHVDNAYRKIGARNRAEATAYALRHGLAA
jgi:DNA-binding CsgD family transcriptional regulator